MMSARKVYFLFLVTIFINAALIALGIFYLKQISSNSGFGREQKIVPEDIQNRQELDASSLKNEILAESSKNTQDLINQALATVSGTRVVEKVSTQSSKNPVAIYIPMGGSSTTTSKDWYTLDDSAVYINLINDYGKSATVSWEAQLKIEHGNGIAYARIWDDTNKIAVNGSEVSTSNNSSFKLVSTGNLPFWAGRNLYKIQIKSLNSYPVTITSAKLRIFN